MFEGVSFDFTDSERSEQVEPQNTKTGEVAQHTFPVAHGKDFFGYLVLKEKQPLDKKELALIYNAIALLAVILQNRKISDLLKSENKELTISVGENEKFIQNITFTVPILIYIFDTKKGVNLYANKELTEMLGYSQKDLDDLGEGFLATLTHRDDISKIVTHHTLLDSMNPGEVREIEYRLKGKDGLWHWLSSRDTPYLKDDKGGTLQILGTATDITEKKANENQLKTINTRLRDVVEVTRRMAACTDLNSFSEALCDGFTSTLDVSGCVFYLLGPEGFKRMAGKGHHDFPEILPFREYREDRIANRLNSLAKKRIWLFQLTDSQNMSNGFIALWSKQNGEFSLQDTEIGAVLTSYSSSAIGTLQAREKLRIKEEQARQSDKMKALGQLAGGVAHDFNNMLGGIVGFSEMLKDELTGNEELSSYAETIIKTAERASDLTKKLLSFSRKGKKVSQKISMHEIIKDVIVILERTVSKKITIETSLKASCDTIEGDSSQLQSALLNLALNARDAMPEGGRLLFSSVNEKEPMDGNPIENSQSQMAGRSRFLLKIADSGKGIPEKVIPHIFEPFFTTKEVGHGTGLGLAAVYGTIQDHHGVIGVHSKEGEGTEFEISLPLISDGSPTDHDSPDSSPVYSGTRGTILLVDDEQVIRLVGKNHLTKEGYNVVVARDGEEAIRIFRKEKDKFQLILLDLVMPNMDGRECFLKLRKIDPDIPILLCSGFTTESAINDLLKMKHTKFLNKPYLRLDFLKIIAELLQK